MTNKLEQAVERASLRSEKLEARAAKHGIDSDTSKADEIWKWYGETPYQAEHWNPSDLAMQILHLNDSKPITKQHFTTHYDEYDHDFGNLARYVEEMYGDSSTERTMMVIRKDDFSELISMIKDLQTDLRRENDVYEANIRRIKELQNRIEELEGEDPLEKHLKSTAWNLNRIANVLEDKSPSADSILRKLGKLQRGGRS